MKTKAEGKLVFDLNGTDVNPFAVYGLKQNPFPQIASYGRTSAVLALQSLGGEPIPLVRAAEYIREKISGHFTSEFVEEVVARFRPGVMMKCTVTFPEN